MAKIGMVGVHYPAAEHRDEFVERVRRAAQVIGQSDGCLEATCWTTAEGAVVSTAQWTTDAAMRASFAAADAAGVDFAFDAREARPREIVWLRSAS